MRLLDSKPRRRSGYVSFVRNSDEASQIPQAIHTKTVMDQTSYMHWTA
jgi:hypothetical protein